MVSADVPVAQSGPRGNLSYDYPLSKEFTLRDLTVIIRRRLRVLVGTTLLLTFITLLVALQLPKEYTAVTDFLINPPRQNLVDIEDIDTSIFSDSAYIDSQVVILRSPQLLGDVVERLNLVADPEFNLELNNGIDENTIQSNGTDEVRTAVIDELLDKTSAQRQSLTLIISIAATSKDPEKAAIIANAIADMYLENELKWRLQTIERANVWLNEQLAVTQEKLTKSERAVEKFRSENDLLDVLGQSLNEQQRSEVSAQIVIAQADLAEGRARLERLREIMETSGRVETLTEVLASPVISELRLQQAEVVRRLAELSTRYGERHPQMIDARAELRDLNFQIRQEANRIAASLENEVNIVETRIRSMQQSLGMLGEEAALDEQSRIELNDLVRDAEANRRLYESLLEGSKKSAALVGSDLIDIGARRISQASAPLEPSFPNLVAIAALSLLISSFLGFTLVFLLETFDDGIRTPTQLEELLGVRHLASIPLVEQSERTIRLKTRELHDYVAMRPTSIFSESIRNLRSAISLASVDESHRIVAITSSVPDEGKTSISLSICAQAAGAGIKTLLIDADTRHPTVAKALNIRPKKHNLMHVLLHEVRLEKAIQHHKLGFDVLLASESDSVKRNIADLFASKAFTDVIREIKSKYDLAIFDTAPVIPVVDTSILAAKCDVTVLLIAWDRTPRDAVEQSLRRLEEFGANVAGAALSQVDLRKYAGMYGDSYYYKKYGKYYNN